MQMIVAAFLPRAFRRPVGLEEVEPYARLLETRLAAGDCFEDAMRRSVVATAPCAAGLVLPAA